MEISLRDAVMISIGIHLAIVMPLWGKARTADPARKERSVDYVVLKEVAKTPAEDAEPETAETPRMEVKAKVEPVPAPVASDPREEIREDALADMAQKQASIKSGKDYIGYYQLIREKIRSRAKRNYRKYYGEGEVTLNFVLDRSGRLSDSAVDESAGPADQDLKAAALSSLREASPFPPFPKALPVQKMAFDVTILFRKDR